jgi:hypothetical protein|tara:strand:+ start:344 stop:727 length:384 start_codon:yes stop_codon:yes gene_type:complete
MASILRVNTLTDASSNNSVPMATVASGSAKAWIHFQGTSTSAINDSFNISGLTDNGTGNYTITIENDMVNVSYSSPCAASDSGITNSDTMVNPYTWATGSVSIGTNNNSGTLVDRSDTNITIHGDLA